jgi:hypothetical protein
MTVSNHKLWVDPPAGWRYGFPRVWDKSEHPDLERWLIDKGYPESDAEFAMRYLRTWEANDDE